MVHFFSILQLINNNIPNIGIYLHINNITVVQILFLKDVHCEFCGLFLIMQTGFEQQIIKQLYTSITEADKTLNTASG